MQLKKDCMTQEDQQDRDAAQTVESWNPSRRID
jgi:hypothetical protein